MIIYLHNISCDAIVLDKTSYLSATPQSTTAYLKASENDLLYLTIIIDTSTALTSFNYLYIPDLLSYYFVSRRKILDNNRYQLELEKDVLFSNLTKIKNSYAIVTRSDNYGQKDIADPTDAFGAADKVFYTDLTNYNISKFNFSNPHFLVAYYDSHLIHGTYPGVGNYPESYTYTNSTNTYDDGISPNINANNFILGLSMQTNYRVLTMLELSYLALKIAYNQDILTFIKGIYLIPFEITTGTDETKYRVIDIGTQKMCIGDNIINFGDISGNHDNIHAPYSFRNRYVFQNFKLFTTDTYQSYYFQNPYHKYEIWCPMCGWVEIPSNFIINRRVKIYYTFDIESGQSECVLYDAETSNIIKTIQAQFLKPINLSTSDMNRIFEQKTSLALNTAIGTISSILTIAGGAMSGNSTAVAGGILSASKTATNAITGFTQLHETGHLLINDPNQAVQMPLTFRLKETYKDIYRTNLMGRPCNISYLTLSSFTGYIECLLIKLSDNTGLCKDEIDKIKILLQKGVYAS